MSAFAVYAIQPGGDMRQVSITREWFDRQNFHPTDTTKSLQGFPHSTLRLFERTDLYGSDTIWVGE